MKKLLPYEEQIVGKLPQLHIPRMEDAIWSRIEGMLEADAKFDESDSYQKINTNSNTLLLTNIIKVVIFFFITAFIVSVLFIRSKRIQKPVSKSSIHVTTSSEKNEKFKVETTLKKTAKPVIKKGFHDMPDYRKKILDSVEQTIPVLDSIILIQEIPESTLLKPKILLPIMKDSSFKKLKGVKGIFDSNYQFRIEKKDSLNKD